MSRAPYCLKCRSFTTLDQDGRCEDCHSHDIEMRATPDLPKMDPPMEPKPARAPRFVPPERGKSLFQKMRESL